MKYSLNIWKKRIPSRKESGKNQPQDFKNVGKGSLLMVLEAITGYKHLKIVEGYRRSQKVVRAGYGIS